MRQSTAIATALLLLAGCAGQEGPQASGAAPAAEAESEAQGDEGSAGETLPTPDAAAEADPPPQPGGGEAPEIYMEVASAGGGAVSLTFASDESRDGTPGDDPAVRITPAEGDCNAEQLDSHAFAADARPVFGPEMAAQGVGADKLPAFMAVTASRAMISQGFAEAPEGTRAQNICTRKLWERLVSPGSGQ